MDKKRKESMSSRLARIYFLQGNENFINAIPSIQFITIAIVVASASRASSDLLLDPAKGLSFVQEHGINRVIPTIVACNVGHPAFYFSLSKFDSSRL